jgi:hypothetical protein
MATIFGFFLGLFFVYTNNSISSNFIYIIGFVSFLIGMFSMVGKAPVTGGLGGLLTGFGLGVTAASLFFTPVA